VIYILGYGGKDETSRRIAHAYNKGFSLLTSDSELPSDAEEQVLVRWGNISHQKWDSIFRLVLNEAEAVGRNIDKLDALRMMRRKGISIPRFYETRDLKPDVFPVLGRRQAHARGRNIKLLKGIRDFRRDNASDFWVEFIPALKEYRYHVFGSRIVRVSEKVQTPGAHKWIRSFRRGWDFIEIKASFPETTAEAVGAVKAIGLDWGAVDIILSEAGKPFVLEVNTGPRLNKEGRRIWVKAIKRLIREKKERFSLSA
jgi:hypothetical protein